MSTFPVTKRSTFFLFSCLKLKRMKPNLRRNLVVKNERKFNKYYFTKNLRGSGTIQNFIDFCKNLFPLSRFAFKIIPTIDRWEFLISTLLDPSKYSHNSISVFHLLNNSNFIFYLSHKVSPISLTKRTAKRDFHVKIIITLGIRVRSRYKFFKGWYPRTIIFPV